MEYVKYSYEDIVSKLSCFVIHNQPVRIIASFSSSDPGRDRANLVLLKQFGVVPLDTYSQHGELDDDQLLKLSGFVGLTIIFESILVNEATYKSFFNRDSDNAKAKAASIPLSRSSQSQLRKIPLDIDPDYLEFTSYQSEKLSATFQQSQELCNSGYVYLSGFSIKVPSTCRSAMIKTEFLPWYLEIANQPGSRRIIRQPYLTPFIQQLIITRPVVTNLDQAVQEMINRESENDN